MSVDSRRFLRCKRMYERSLTRIINVLLCLAGRSGCNIRWKAKRNERGKKQSTSVNEKRTRIKHGKNQEMIASQVSFECSACTSRTGLPVYLPCRGARLTSNRYLFFCLRARTGWRSFQKGSKKKKKETNVLG